MRILIVIILSILLLAGCVSQKNNSVASDENLRKEAILHLENYLIGVSPNLETAFDKSNLISLKDHSDFLKIYPKEALEKDFNNYTIEGNDKDFFTVIVNYGKDSNIVGTFHYSFSKDKDKYKLWLIQFAD
jgi:hypothetical protein